MTDSIKYDAYSITTTDEEQFRNELLQLEEETDVITDVIAKDVRLAPCPKPIEGCFGDAETQEDTLNHSNLVAEYGMEKLYVRDCAVPTIETVAARLSGNGLSTTHERAVSDYTRGINYFIQNSRAGVSAMFILRGGKLTAMHGRNYAYMPQAQLFGKVRDSLDRTYGGATFAEGSVSHEKTRAMLLLDDQKIAEGYNNLCKKIGSSYHGSFLCGVIFETSDVSTSCVDVRPVFVDEKTDAVFSFSEGIMIKHEKTGEGKEPMDVLEARMDKQELLIMFQESMEKIKALEEVPIFNPANCVVSLCNRYHIPRKYGEYARAMVESYETMTAHDIYLFMSNIIPEAKRAGASEGTLINLESAVFRVLSAVWPEHDHGGVIPWKA